MSELTLSDLLNATEIQEENVYDSKLKPFFNNHTNYKSNGRYYKSVDEYLDDMRKLDIVGIIDAYIRERGNIYRYATSQEFLNNKLDFSSVLSVKINDKWTSKSIDRGMNKCFTVIDGVPIVIFAGTFVESNSPYKRYEYRTYFPLVRKRDGKLHLKFNNSFVMEKLDSRFKTTVWSKL